MPAKFKSKMTIPDYLIVYFKFLCTKKAKISPLEREIKPK